MTTLVPSVKGTNVTALILDEGLVLFSLPSLGSVPVLGDPHWRPGVDLGFLVCKIIVGHPALVLLRSFLFFFFQQMTNNSKDQIVLIAGESET